MAQVTGFTAERMKVIEDTTVIDGEVIGNDLILVTREGTPINAGNVRGERGPEGQIGPEGPQGPPGPQGIQGPIGLTGPSSVVVCTSATRPGSPTPGLRIFETDTGKELVYYDPPGTAAVGWYPPWNAPWGFVAEALVTSTSVQFGAETILMQINAVPSTPNRRYKWTMKWELSSEVSGDTVFIAQFKANNISGTSIDRYTDKIYSVGTSSSHLWYVLETMTGAAAVIRCFTVFRAAGAGNLQMQAAPSYPGSIRVEDIGPA